MSNGDGIPSRAPWKGSCGVVAIYSPLKTQEKFLFYLRTFNFYSYKSLLFYHNSNNRFYVIMENASILPVFYRDTCKI